MVRLVDRYASFDRLRFEWPDGPTGGVLQITLDDPDKLNATDAAMHLQLSRVFREVADDDAVRAVAADTAWCVPLRPRARARW